jgi:hypothetical protein
MGSEIQQLFLASLDEVLEDLLGARVRQTIYNCLREQGALREEMPSRLDLLIRFLDLNLGKGSKTVQKSVARRLYKKLGWELNEVPSFDLSDYVSHAIQRIERRSNLLKLEELGLPALTMID